MELDSTEAIKSAVEAGLGVGFISRRAIQKEIKLDAVREAHITKLGIQPMLRFSILGVPSLVGPRVYFSVFSTKSATRHPAKDADEKPFSRVCSVAVAISYLKKTYSPGLGVPVAGGK